MLSPTRSRAVPENFCCRCRYRTTSHPLNQNPGTLRSPVPHCPTYYVQVPKPTVVAWQSWSPTGLPPPGRSECTRTAPRQSCRCQAKLSPFQVQPTWNLRRYLQTTLTSLLRHQSAPTVSTDVSDLDAARRRSIFDIALRHIAPGPLPSHTLLPLLLLLQLHKEPLARRTSRPPFNAVLNIPDTDQRPLSHPILSSTPYHIHALHLYVHPEAIWLLLGFSL